MTVTRPTSVPPPGIVAGLVAITPAAGYVSGPAPIFIGLAAGVICCYAVRLKNKFGYDDALDVVGVHFVGGLVGSLLIGFFANPAFFDGAFDEGIFYGGDASAPAASRRWPTASRSSGRSPSRSLLMLALKKTIGVRVSTRKSRSASTRPMHAETAYHPAPAI